LHETSTSKAVSSECHAWNQTYSNGAVDVVFSAGMDALIWFGYFCRLARDLLIQETILGDMQESGIEIISVPDADLLVRQILGIIAKDYNAMHRA
jgi:hypothetical protein